MAFVTSTVLAAAALGTAAVGTAASINSSKQAAKAINNQTRVQQQIAENENLRTRINSIRASRIARAQASQAAVNQGAANTSVAAGIQGALTSQGNADISFLDRQGALGAQSAYYATKANRFQARAQAYSSIASFAMQAAGSQFVQNADSTFAKIFKKPSTPGYSGVNFDVIPGS